MKTQFRRPTYGAKKDANHANILRELSQMVGGWWHVVDDNGDNLPAYTGNCQGFPFLIVDTSQAGGLTLDTRLYCNRHTLDIEIKMPDKRGELTSGETMYFALTPETGRIVTSAEEYYAIIVQMIEMAA
jgi:hypothetical protein